MDGVALSTGTWLDRIMEAWRWWLDQLAGFLPASARHALTAPPDAILIDVEPDDFVIVRRAEGFESVIARIPRDEFAVRALRLSVPRGRGLTGLLSDPVILRLPAAEALMRTLQLPKSAGRDLDAILKHEVARQSPLGSEDIYYDYRAVPSAEGLDVTLRIARRAPVEAHMETCRNAGIALSAIAFQGDLETADGASFPVDPAEARRSRMLPKLIPALAALVVLLVAGLVGASYLRGEAVAADLADRVDAARSHAAVVLRLERQLNAANRQAAFLAQQKRNPAAAAVLATVARLLPDDAWLYEFEMNGNEVRLHGFSPEAASLIGLFDSSPFFSSAQFRAPLMQAPSANLQRFDLSMKLGKDAS
jgi:general secretion pathway protein L